jgi:hypothetical protein
MADEIDDEIGPYDDLCDLPLEVLVLKHAIVLIGPDGIALAMTADAIEASIARLQEALNEARRNAASAA